MKYIYILAIAVFIFPSVIFAAEPNLMELLVDQGIKKIAVENLKKIGITLTTNPTTYKAFLEVEIAELQLMRPQFRKLIADIAKKNLAAQPPKPQLLTPSPKIKYPLLKPTFTPAALSKPPVAVKPMSGGKIGGGIVALIGTFILDQTRGRLELPLKLQKQLGDLETASLELYAHKNTIQKMGPFIIRDKNGDIIGDNSTELKKLNLMQSNILNEILDIKDQLKKLGY